MDVLRGAVPELETAAGVDIRSSTCPSLQTVVVLSDTETRYFIEKMQILWLTQLDPTNSGTLRLKDAIDSGTPSFVYKVHNLQRRIQFDEPANIQFTSVIRWIQLTANRQQFFVDQGTTGNPKGATLSHHNIVNNALAVGNRYEYSKQVGDASFSQSWNMSRDQLSVQCPQDQKKLQKILKKLIKITKNKKKIKKIIKKYKIKKNYKKL